MCRTDKNEILRKFINRDLKKFYFDCLTIHFATSSMPQIFVIKYSIQM